MEGIWQKFHPLYEADLKVGLETVFSRSSIVSLEGFYAAKGMLHQSNNEPIKRLYEPATKIVGSCVDNGPAAQVFFTLKPLRHLYRRLVFSRKLDESQKPRLWMVAARHGEIASFGFDSWNSKDPRYLALAYPGKNPDGQFTPVYFKIQRKEEEKSFIYLEVWSLDDEAQALVCARRIDEKDAPEHLRTATPDSGEALRASFQGAFA